MRHTPACRSGSLSGVTGLRDFLSYGHGVTFMYACQLMSKVSQELLYRKNMYYGIVYFFYLFDFQVYVELHARKLCIS